MIKRNPSIKLSQLWKVIASPSNLNYPTEEKCGYTGYARFAFFKILEALKLPKRSGILLPAFVCDALLVPIQYLGLEPQYYGIDNSLKVDLSTVKINSNTCIFLSINYFGFSQNFETIQSFVNNHKLIWINDNSHGYASMHYKRDLETFGDFSITSFRKSIPSINGARWRVNNNKFCELVPEIHKQCTHFKKQHRLFRFVAKSFFDQISFHPFKTPDYSDINSFAEKNIMPFQADKLSMKINYITDNNFVQNKRRDAYSAIREMILKNKFNYIKNLEELENPGNAPLAMPIKVADAIHWGKILKISRDMGIDIYTWPSLPKIVKERDLFGAATMWRQLLFFPIHQNLDILYYKSKIQSLLKSIV